MSMGVIRPVLKKAFDRLDGIPDRYRTHLRNRKRVNPGRAQCAIQGVAQKALEAYRTSFFIEVTVDGGLSPVFDLQFWFGRTLV